MTLDHRQDVRVNLVRVHLGEAARRVVHRRQKLVHELDRPCYRQSDPHILISRDRQLGIERPDAAQRRQTRYHAGLGNEGGREQRTPNLRRPDAGRRNAEFAEHVALTIDETAAAACHHRIRAVAQYGDLLRELRRQPFIIGIEEGHELSSRRRDAFIHRAALATISRHAEQAYPVIAIGRDDL